MSARHSEEPKEPTDSAASTAHTYAADARQALAAAESNPAAVVPADLQKQGAEAAAALNQALAAEGLMEFKF